MIKDYIINLAKKWVYQDFRLQVLDLAKWNDNDTKELKSFMGSETGKKFLAILNNSEAQECYAAFNEKAVIEWRHGRVSGIASIRTLIQGLMHEKKEEVEADLTVQELDDMIKDRLTGYMHRRFNE
jgi:hypothetical protein